MHRVVARDPAERFRDMSEFAGEMEAGPAWMATSARRPQTVLERAPLRFWQGVAVILGLALLAALVLR
ncbi:MAG: hypothetical protein WCF13_01875 [Stellaceae bacterium]